MYEIKGFYQRNFSKTIPIQFSSPIPIYTQFCIVVDLRVNYAIMVQKFALKKYYTRLLRNRARVNLLGIVNGCHRSKFYHRKLIPIERKTLLGLKVKL